MHQRHTERAGAARPRAGRRERQGGAKKQGSGIITTDEYRVMYGDAAVHPSSASPAVRRRQPQAGHPPPAARAAAAGVEPPALEAGAQRVRSAAVMLGRAEDPARWAKESLRDGLDQPVVSV